MVVVVVVVVLFLFLFLFLFKVVFARSVSHRRGLSITPGGTL